MFAQHNSSNLLSFLCLSLSPSPSPSPPQKSNYTLTQRLTDHRFDLYSPSNASRVTQCTRVTDTPQGETTLLTVTRLRATSVPLTSVSAVCTEFTVTRLHLWRRWVIFDGEKGSPWPCNGASVGQCWSCDGAHLYGWVVNNEREEMTLVNKRD